MAEWWKKNKLLPLNDRYFKRIIEFYLFLCPVEISSGKNIKKVSVRVKSLRERGLTGSSLTILLNHMKKTSSGFLEYRVLSADKDDVCSVSSEIESQNKEHGKHFEMIVFHERSDTSKSGAILYAIRNAFAHGSFSVVEANDGRTYYFESRKGEKVKSRIRLREKTLLMWIEYINMSPTELRSM